MAVRVVQSVGVVVEIVVLARFQKGFGVTVGVWGWRGREGLSECVCLVL